MTKLSPSSRPSPTQLLARVLETPDLADRVQSLAAATLARLIDQVGIADASEIVALATTEQLARVFDEDLWKNERPGEEERFDVDRFVVWLEAMLEAGDAFVAEKLSELPEDLVTLAFHKAVLVVPLETLMAELGDGADDAEATEKALSNCLSEELDEFQVIARRSDGWDAILAALLALDRDHHDVLARILERCAAMNAHDIDESGLYDVLTSEEMLETDVGGEREDRRGAAGYVAPEAAAAFLKLADGNDETPPTKHDPLTRAYLRGLDRGSKGPVPVEGPKRADSESAFLGLLEEAGVAERERPRLPARRSGASPAEASIFVRGMQSLAVEDPERFAERSEELAYLANVLVAGCSIDGRRVRPIEAIRAAIIACDAGLETVLSGASTGSQRSAAAAKALAEHPADGLFRLGWKRLGDGKPISDLGNVLRRAR